MRRRDPRSVAWRRGFAAGFGAVAMCLFAVSAAQGTICKYIDADGNVVYSNIAPGRGLRKLSCDIVDDSSRRASGAKSSPTPAGFPRVEPDVQRSRDEMRRKVLGDELASEEKLLADARSAYGNGAPQPLADEKADAEKYRRRIARLRDAVQLHERNVDALHKELAGIH